MTKPTEEFALSDSFRMYWCQDSAASPSRTFWSSSISSMKKIEAFPYSPARLPQACKPATRSPTPDVTEVPGHADFLQFLGTQFLAAQPTPCVEAKVAAFLANGRTPVARFGSDVSLLDLLVLEVLPLLTNLFTHRWTG